MPRAFKEHEREILRLRLIRTGMKLLNKVGAKGLTVDEAAREAGISKGSFYAFFPSREDYILSIFEVWENEFRDELLKDIIEGPGSARERLARFFLNVFAAFDREPGLAKLGFGEIMRLMERLPPDRLAAHMANDSRVLEAAGKSWVESGIVAATDLPAIKGIMDFLLVIAIHRADFVDAGQGAALKILAEGLAMRLAVPGAPPDGVNK